MNIQLLRHDIRVLQQKTRMPFRYGIATMKEFPLLFLELTFRFDGQTKQGVASDLLPPKWFTKDPHKLPDREIDEMLEVIQQAVERAYSIEATTPFDFWWQLYLQVDERRCADGMAPLLAHFGTSLVERALLDAFCRNGNVCFATLVRDGGLGIELERVHPELAGMAPGELLPETNLETVLARHTVGLGDPLTAEGIADGERVDDELPQALSECIGRYGLRHFKVKISGDLEVDLSRLQELCDLVHAEVGAGARYSLDGNEQFTEAHDFFDFWKALQGEDWFARFHRQILFIEQPFHRDVALTDAVSSLSRMGEEMPPMIIDESDGELNALPRALALGYSGTSHKNCKGVFKGISNRCLIAKRSRENPKERLLMSGEDLCNQGPVALLQDLAVMATLGINSVERNGHHYCRGLSGLDTSLQERVESAHSDLYKKEASDLITLGITGGQLNLKSVNQAPFGYGFTLPMESLPSIQEWQRDRSRDV